METRLPHRILHMHNPGTAAFIIFMRVPSRGRPGESVHHNYHSVAHALLFCYVQLPNYNEEKLQCIGVLRLSGRGVGEGEREEVQTTGLAANPSRQASERAFFAYYRPDTVCHILRNVHQINVAAAALPTPPCTAERLLPSARIAPRFVATFYAFFQRLRRRLLFQVQDKCDSIKPCHAPNTAKHAAVPRNLPLPFKPRSFSFSHRREAKNCQA